MSRAVLLLATTTGYQTRMFGEAAARAGVELVFATDRCDQLDDPWRDGAIPIRYSDEARAVAAIAARAAVRPIHGLLAVGDRPVVVAARAAEALGLPGHPPGAAAASRDKRLLREHLRAAGLAVPWFRAVPLEADPHTLADAVPYPCVVKPVVLSASRGVIRADDPAAFVEAYGRVRRLLDAPDVRALGDPATRAVQIERYIDGDEFAIEAVLDRGRLHVLAIFDKPDPLTGPFFEETIYVTPSRLAPERQTALVETVRRGVAALGLWHGPLHAECRVGPEGVFLLELAARPIGGLCARALRVDGPAGVGVSLEELLLRHAAGEPLGGYTRERAAAGVMMIPIPRAGVFREAQGTEEAARVPGVEEIRITARPDQRLLPLPEGSSYLGFIFARGTDPGDVEQSLRRAHAALRFRIDPLIAVKPGT